jgi:hypothetical protein
MSGDMPPLPQYAFMAWCLVKAQGHFYFYFLIFDYLKFVRCIIKVSELFHVWNKAKLSLYSEHHAMKAYWGSGGIDPRILDLGTRCR